MITFIIVVVVAAAIAMYGAGIFNQLIRVRVNVDKSWANIDVLLKQRYDEIPKLVKVCEGYMTHERQTLESVTKARTMYLEARTPGQIAKADSELATALKSLFAVSENYPNLKANEGFMQLQQRVSYLENQIADRREFYNDSVAVFNTRIQQIPDVVVARMMNYQPAEMYKVAEAEKASPEINFNVPK